MSDVLKATYAEKNAVQAVFSFLFNATRQDIADVYGIDAEAEIQQAYLTEKFEKAKCHPFSFYGGLDNSNRERLVSLALHRQAENEAELMARIGEALTVTTLTALESDEPPEGNYPEPDSTARSAF